MSWSEASFGSLWVLLWSMVSQLVPVSLAIKPLFATFTCANVVMVAHFTYVCGPNHMIDTHDISGISIKHIPVCVVSMCLCHAQAMKMLCHHGEGVTHPCTPHACDMCGCTRALECLHRAIQIQQKRFC